MPQDLLHTELLGLCTVDKDDVVTDCNSLCHQLLGFNDEKSALGRRFHDIAGHRHQDLEACTAANCWLFQTPEADATSRRESLTLRGADGVWRVVDCVVSPVLIDGVIAGRAYAFVDMNGAAEREAALREALRALELRVGESTGQLQASQRLINIFYEHSSECHAVLIDAGEGQFRYEEVNPSTLTLYRRSREEVIGRTTNEIFGAQRAAELNHFLTVCLALGKPYRYERKQGDGIVEAVATPVPHDVGTAQRIVVTAREVTAQRRLEEQLRQAQKMEAVGQLTGGLAHDFNNLLAIISGSLEVFKKRMLLGKLEGVERYIDAAQGATKRAASLTQRLLAFSRRQTLDPKTIDVNRLIAGMEDLLRRTLGPEITLEVVGAGGLWATLVDPPQLENALLNLCINARDAMPDGGRLTIETANRWLDERIAKERELPKGQYISLCVTDTGTGMTPEIAQRAFDPFFTTKPIGKGTGLGLSMIYGFVRQSGGQVRIYSELGKGSTLCLYLPRHFGPTELVESAETEHALDPGEGQVVLVLDDEPMVRMIVVSSLQEGGYQVIECAEGAAALKILASDQHIDLLITDVGLPGGMNGRQVADAGRTTRPDLRILFITGYAENAAIGNGHLEAGMEVLTKPFTLAALSTKVSNILASES